MKNGTASCANNIRKVGFDYETDFFYYPLNFINRQQRMIVRINAASSVISFLISISVQIVCIH